jgi:hypothetical protein
MMVLYWIIPPGLIEDQTVHELETLVKDITAGPDIAPMANVCWPASANLFEKRRDGTCYVRARQLHCYRFDFYRLRFL